MITFALDLAGAVLVFTAPQPWLDELARREVQPSAWIAPAEAKQQTWPQHIDVKLPAPAYAALVYTSQRVKLIVANDALVWETFESTTHESCTPTEEPGLDCVTVACEPPWCGIVTDAPWRHLDVMTLGGHTVNPEAVFVAVELVP